MALTVGKDEESNTPGTYRWHDVRFIGALPGRYALPDRRERSIARVPVYACRLCSISTRLLVALGPLIGDEDEYISCHFDEFGIIQGRISRRLASGFAVNITMTTEEREKLGAKIDWQKKRAQAQVPENRDHKRMIPRDPRSTIVTADGTRIPCFVMDVSRSGAAVSADYWPEIGTPLALGRMVARVVRHLDVGFAVKFVEIQQADNLEYLLQPLAS